MIWECVNSGNDTDKYWQSEIEITPTWLRFYSNWTRATLLFLAAEKQEKLASRRQIIAQK